mgnify:CR=1 FL=1
MKPTAQLDPVSTTGKPKTDKDIVLEAVANFAFAEQAYASSRSQQREDLKYVAGLQANASPNDPFGLQVNLLNPFLRQITSEARSANPSIRVIPEGSGADVDIAEARGGLIRAIEQASNAEAIYQKSLWYAAASGEAYCFIDSEYISEDSFEQNLKIVMCPNPEMVFLDPLHEEMTGADAEWGFIIKDIANAAYLRQFPDSELSEKLNSGGWNKFNMPKAWSTDKTVRVAQYWVKQYRMKPLWLVQDPETMEQFTMDTKPGPELVLLRKREVQVCEVKGFPLNGIEVLEKIDWPGSRIPIFKTTGEEFYIGSQKAQFGAVRHAIDPQRQYNYAVSRQTEMIDLAPKNSFVITTRQLGNNAEKWANANRIAYGYLDYTAEPGSPPPSRVSGLDANAFAGVAQTRQQAYEDMKRVFGLNDSSMGSAAGDMSGVAIGKQVEQGSRSTYHFFDNLLLTIKAVGCELNNLIPYFYDTDRLIRIIKPTNEEQMIAINSISNSMRYDFTKGQYAVTVTTGPAYASKRQEAYDALSGIMTALPQSGQYIGDLVASQVDSPVAKLAAARIRATIPQEVLAATGENDQQDMAPAEQLQQAQQELSVSQQKLKMLELEKQELQVKVKISEDKAAMELTKADMEHMIKTRELDHQEKLALVEAEIKMMQLKLEERKLDMAEKQLHMNATMNIHRVNEDSKPEKPEDVLRDIDVPSEANIGGKLD